jgi:hypothetical protein
VIQITDGCAFSVFFHLIYGIAFCENFDALASEGDAVVVAPAWQRAANQPHPGSDNHRYRRLVGDPCTTQPMLELDYWILQVVPSTLKRILRCTAIA